jgi:hypothetical protein
LQLTVRAWQRWGIQGTKVPFSTNVDWNANVKI